MIIVQDTSVSQTKPFDFFILFFLQKPEDPTSLRLIPLIDLYNHGDDVAYGNGSVSFR